MIKKILLKMIKEKMGEMGLVSAVMRIEKNSEKWQELVTMISVLA